MDYDAYRQSPEWAVMRRWKIDEADHRCQLCDATGPVLDVHHRTYERIGRELQADLVVLCRACHAAVHGRESAPTMREAYAAQSTRPVSEVIAKIKAAESRGDNVEAERLAQETLIAKRREAERELEAKQGGAEVVP
jgi:5-methylcytosine-specific restriction endonuclease McrA